MKTSQFAEIMTPYWDDNPKNLPWPPRIDYYEHYATWAGLVKPARYLEIGVAYGWSTMAVLFGWRHINHVVLIDNELYEIPLLEAVRRIGGFCTDQGIRMPVFAAHKLDTTAELRLDYDDEYFDLIHIDGEHGEQAVYHDLHLCQRLLSHRGSIIVDDLKLPGIQAGVERFLAENLEFTGLIHLDHQNHYLLWRP